MKHLLFIFLLLQGVVLLGQESSVFNYTLKKTIVTTQKNSFTTEVSCIGQLKPMKEGQVSLYYSELATLDNIKAWQYKKGKKQFIKKKNIINHAVLTGSFYGGYRASSFEYEGSPLGYKIGYEYTKTTNDLMFLSVLELNDYDSTNIFEYEIHVLPNQKLHYKIEGDTSQLKTWSIKKQRSNKAGYGQMYKVISKPKHPIKRQKNRIYNTRQIKTNPVIRLIVTRGEKPSTCMNIWYNQLVKPQTNISAATLKDFENVCEGEGSNCIKAVFETVKKRVSYIDFENGIGAVQPRDVNDIWLNKQGDCKDMSNLLCQVLKSKGFDAYMTLSATISHPFGMEFMNLSSANHAICAVKDGEEWIYLDATERHGVYGLPSRQIQNTPAFIVRPRGGILTQVPKVDAKDNLTQFNYNLTKEGNSLNGKAEVVFHGLSQVSLKSINGYFNKEKFEKILEEQLEAQAKKMRFENTSYEEKEMQVQVKSDIRSRRNFTKVGDKYYLSLNFLPFPHSQPKSIVPNQELLLYETLNKAFNITLNLDYPMSFEQKEPIIIKENGIEFTYTIEQKSPTQLQFKYHYICNHVILKDDAVITYNKLNQVIEATFAKSLIMNVIP